MTENDKIAAAAGVDLARLGREVVAYVRPVSSPTGIQFAIHGADGEVLGMAPDQSAALGTIIANGLRPLWLN